LYSLSSPPLKRIEEQEKRYDDIQATKEDLMAKHRDEVKSSLIRKHEISDAMEQMKITNDYSLLDKLFAKTKKATSKGKKHGGGKGDHEGDEKDDRAQTA
jgi:hypothetical protein